MNNYGWIVTRGTLLLITLLFWKQFMEYQQKTFFTYMGKYQTSRIFLL